MNDLLELIDGSIKNGITSGKTLDAITLMRGSDLINAFEKFPFLPIELNSVETFQLFFNESECNFWYVSGGIFHFVAYYGYDEKFPLGRCYYIKQKELIYSAQIAMRFFKKHQNFFQESDINNLVGATTANERVENYISKNINDDKLKAVKGLFDGRKENTSTSNCLYLKTEGCLVCGKTITHHVSSTITNTETGLMIAFFTCDKHFKETQAKESNMDWLFEQLNVENIFPTQKLTQEEIYEEVKLSIEDGLGCIIEKVNDSKKEITCKRIKSNLKIILRITAPFDYAYMFYDTNGKQILRIDSANHHKDKLTFGPDHIHLEPELENSNVKESFTTGFLYFDFKGIKNHINKLENEFVYDL